MRAHVKAAESFERVDVTPAQARERFAGEDQDYKVELIDDLVANAAQRTGPPGTGAGTPLETVSLYTNGPFTDLCRGPHAPSTKSVGAFKLTSVAGAYWRGDSTRTMLTRIYGTAFFSKAQLEEYLERVERRRNATTASSAKSSACSCSPTSRPAPPFWLPPGTAIWNELVAVSREMGRERGLRRGEDAADLRRGAVEDLGALGEVPREHVHGAGRGARDGREADELPRARAPVRRPAPLLPGPAGALLRAGPVAPQRALRRAARAAAGCRHFAQDDAHIFCTEEQVQEEVRGCLELAFATYALFDFEVRLELSTRPEQRIGTDEMWDKAEESARERARRAGAGVRAEPGRRRVLRPEDRHAHDRLARALAGSWGRCSWTTRCPSASS